MRRSSKFFLFVTVAAMACAIFSGNARAATATLMPGGSTPFNVHVDDNTIPVGLFCPNAVVDPTSCPRVPFVTTGSGTVTATATYPTGQDVDLVLCTVETIDSMPLDNCPNGSEILTCTTAVVDNPDGTTTKTLTCLNVPAGSYELLIVPVFVATCPIFPDPLDPCFAGPGITVTGTISLGSGGIGGGNGGGGTSSASKVTGGGKVESNQQPFSLVGFDQDTSKGKVYYQDNRSCKFRSTAITSVTVTVTATGGYAHFTGQGIVTAANGAQTTVSFTADATDNGEGASQTGPDQFKLTAPGCSNGLSTVVGGNIQIHPTKA